MMGSSSCTTTSCQLLAVLLLLLQATDALISNQPVSSLLQQHVEQIAQLKSITTEEVGSIESEHYSNDVFYLRYCLEYDGDKQEAQDVL